jgi:hypothetical protein
VSVTVATVNMRRLNILLVLWCVFLMAPRVLAQTGAFGPVGIDKSIPGMMALSWVLGYLAQFAVFMWMMSIGHEQKILWWFVASLLPWAADWTAPASAPVTFLFLLVTVAMAVWIARGTQREETLQEHGIGATGTVLEVLKPLMNVVINNVYIKRKVRLRIEREDGAPAYEGILNGLFMLGEIPSPGDRLPLRVDPANPQRFELETQESPSSSSSAAPEPAAPSHQAARPAAGRGDIVDELGKLASLRDRGALTESEFNAAKKKLLGD